MIVSRLNDFRGERRDTIIDLPGKFDEFSMELQQRLTLDFAHFGLRLSHLYLTSITPPEEVQKAIVDRSRMNAITDMDKFDRLKAAMAMEKAAENQGEAGAGLGMGIGMMLPAMFNPAAVQAAGAGKVQPAGAGATTITCPDCSNEIDQESRFCPLCGHQLVVLSKCHECGKNLTPDAKFCSRCGTATEQKATEVVCGECGTENMVGATFCNQCGTRL